MDQYDTVRQATHDNIMLYRKDAIMFLCGIPHHNYHYN